MKACFGLVLRFRFRRNAKRATILSTRNGKTRLMPFSG